MSFLNGFKEIYKFDKEIIEFVDKEESYVDKLMSEISYIKQYNQLKVLKAFQDKRLTSQSFNWNTGYGYSDMGRETTEEIFSQVFRGEDSLVRCNIVSGTHAISLVLFSLLKSGDKILSITSNPYDTLQQVIGIKGEQSGNLISQGIKYDVLELLDGRINLKSITEEKLKGVKMILIQRSTGYTLRSSLSVEEIASACKKIKNIRKDIIIFVDNCYGEFTECREPLEVGADIIAGSMIKNVGGGLSLTGGYICGNKNLISECANRLTAPGIGKEQGLTFGTTRNILQGLYNAPSVTFESIKVNLLFARVFEKLGFEVFPKANEIRSDVVQTIVLNDENKMISFCELLQEVCAVDSHITPIPYEMPGYTDKVIMSSGGFVEGSTAELSADGPIRDPFCIYLQGGVNYNHGKLALMNILSGFREKGYIKFN